MSSYAQKDILLESGTNELEVIEFTIDGQVFGINVSKVQELIGCMPVKPMQNAHPFIEGIFKPRENIITVINLSAYLGLGPSSNPERDIFMVTEFNNQVIAFHVHTVEGIDRISWRDIRKPDPVIFGGSDGVATGIAEFEKRLITILDFEKIVAEISPQTSIQAEEVDRLGPRVRSERPILIAEDSMLLSKLIVECLHKAGYVNTIKVDDGQEAYDFIQAAKLQGGPIKGHIACLVSDIEMPRMDGHHLTKLVKDDPQLREIPVILFSSLINEQMRLKGQQVGADEQISKPEIAMLVQHIDRLTSSQDEY